MIHLVHPSLPGFSTTNSASYVILCERAKELAALHHRPRNEPTGADFVQARRELTPPESPLEAGRVKPHS